MGQCHNWLMPMNKERMRDNSEQKSWRADIEYERSRSAWFAFQSYPSANAMDPLSRRIRGVRTQ